MTATPIRGSPEAASVTYPLKVNLWADALSAQTKKSRVETIPLQKKLARLPNYTILMMFEKPVMSKTSLTWGFMLVMTILPPLEETVFWSMRNILRPWLDV